VKINMNLRQSLSVKEFNLPSLNRTRMTRIARIFTDPCASVSSVQSVFYRSISLLIEEKCSLMAFFPAPSPLLPQARCKQTCGKKSMQGHEIVMKIRNRFNKSAFICVHLRFVLVYILLPYFSIKTAPASDSARFLTQLNDKFLEINNSRRCEN
jgi:hypothetical protein